MAVFRIPSFVPFEQRKTLVFLPPEDPFPYLLKSWANRVKPIVYNRIDTRTRTSFIPSIVNVPFSRSRATHYQPPHVNLVRHKVLALGPEAYVPIQSAPKRHYEPSHAVKIKSPIIFQTIVTVAQPARVHMLQSPTRTVWRNRPIQNNALPIKAVRNRFVPTVHTRKGHAVPLAAPPPIVLQRRSQVTRTIAVQNAPRGIPYNTPPTVLVVAKTRPFQSPGSVKTVNRFIPAAVNQIPFVVRGRPLHVEVPKFGTRRHTLAIQGPSVTVQSPIFVGNRVRQRTIHQPVLMRPAVITAPQSVLVVRSVRHSQAPVRPEHKRFPFAVDRPVTVNVPFPVPRPLPRWVTVQYPVPHRTTVAAFPPPTVQNVVVTSRRIVR